MNARTAAVALALAVAASIVGCNKQPTFEDAEQLHLENNYPAAVAAYIPFAEKGDYRAQVYLGRYYLQKDSQDFLKAASYFKKAADQGDTDAMYFLGMAYLKGDGVPQNSDVGEQYLLNSAKGGSRKSTTRLCFIYNDKAQETWQIPDFRVAIVWCEKAYQAGDPGGAVMVGGVYGHSPISDSIKSDVWGAAYKLAANKPIDKAFDLYPREQRLLLRAQAYVLYGEFGKNESPATYLDSLMKKQSSAAISAPTKN